MANTMALVPSLVEHVGVEQRQPHSSISVSHEPEIGSLEGMLLCTADSLRILHATAAIRQQLQSTANDLGTKTLFDLGSARWGQRLQRALSILARNPQSCLAVNLSYRSGGTRQVLATVTVQYVEPHDTRCVLVMIHRRAGSARMADDGAQAVRARLQRQVRMRTVELRKSEMRFQTLFEGAPDALLMLNRQGVMTSVNRSAERLFGYERVELIGQKVQTVIPEYERWSDDEHGRLAVHETSGRSRTDRAGVMCRRKDGAQSPVELTVSSSGRQQRWMQVVTVRDVRERRELERYAERAQRLDDVGNLVAGVAHDFNNLLTIIRGAVDPHLHHALVDRSHQMEVDLQSVVHAADQAAGLTRQLLGFVRRDVGVPAAPSGHLPEPIVDAVRPVGLARETILLVEDQAELRRLTERLLRKQGYTVLSAASGPEALSLLSGHAGPVHVLLADAVMPEMSGPQLARTVLFNHPGVKVLFTTNCVAVDMEQCSIECGTAHLVLKPYTASIISRRIREVLAADVAVH